MDRRSAMLSVALVAAIAVGCDVADATRTPETGGGTWLARFLVPSKTVTIDAGTELVVRLDAPVSTATHHVGDSVRARLAEPVLVGDQVVLEPGAQLFGRVIELDPASRIGGRARLGVEFSGVGTPTGMADILASYRVESKSQTGGGAAAGTAVAATNKRPHAALPGGSTIVLTLGAPAEVRLRT